MSENIDSNLNYQIIADNLNSLRSRLGMDKRAFTRYLGFPDSQYTHVTSILLGTKQLTLYSTERIAEAAGVQLYELLTPNFEIPIRK